jgi:hypothetical protein
MSVEGSSALMPHGALMTALLGGLTAGAIDIAYAFAANAPKGMTPVTVLQAVASGLFGPSAFQGGLATAAIGGLLHFLMTILMALLFVLAANHFAPIRSRLVVAGLAYGALIYFGMRWVVLPLSRFPGDLKVIDPGELAVHIFGVGLVIALFARRSLLAPQASL